MRWLGHLLRMNRETPARRALDEFTRKGKRPIGRPKDTWLHMVKQTLKLNDLKIDFKDDVRMIKELETLCSDRAEWKLFVKNMKL